jgi:folate-binding protein YgfZ
MPHAALLTDRSILAIAGPDSRDFLQGLVSNDMAACTQGHAIYAALLTPQGKILFEFFVAAAGAERFLIDCDASRAADLTKRLSMYKLRAKVTIAPAADLAVAALWNGETIAPPPDAECAFADPRLPALGVRLIGSRDALEKIVAANAAGDYRSLLLSKVVPASSDLPPDSVYALDAGFEELNGVSFKKGCYVGQEVTSRMKHRATARRRFVLAESDAPLSSGAALDADGHAIGEIATGADTRALALVRLDRLAEAEAANTPITAAGHPVRLRKPEWFHG